MSQELLQPKLDGKRRFIAESFLCYSYVHIKTGAKNIHRGFLEKSCSLVAENSIILADSYISIFMPHMHIDLPMLLL